ncbi:ribonuclease homolog [Terrapene carolina triunguis]|uniref:ribonuclease homolog n=1 Tax=Terrapene triunguis TaxID=2587831 RepID=UPI000CEF92B5|nr:ribonuclease homolog [Terrapene carolina triunguis]
MALKGSYPVLLLSLVLLGARLALASGQQSTSTNDQFLRWHWDNPKTQATNNTAYCRLLTHCRGISRRNNTFIHDSITAINSICTGKRDGPVTSPRTFKITVCKFNLKTGTATGTPLFHRIVVICKKKLPVHFVKSVRPTIWA